MLKKSNFCDKIYVEKEENMEKIISGMGKIEFDRFYSNKNIVIDSLDKSPIIDSKKIKTISQKQLKRMLNNEYIYNLLNKRNNIYIYQTNAINLLSKYRFDIFAKYYYVKAYVEKKDLVEAMQIYLEHIKAFNNFCEPDGKKRGEEDFLNSFNILIESVKVCNKLDKTIIPISMTGIPIDGAHRIAIALYFNIEIQFCVFDLLDGKYDEDFFLKRGMPQKYVEKVKRIKEEYFKVQMKKI